MTLSKKIIIILSILVLVLLGVLGFLIYNNNSKVENKPDEISVETKPDRVAIIEKVRNLNRLETYQETIQRDVEITVDFGEIKVFDITLFQNRQVHEVAVTGKITAGTDLSNFSEENVEISEDGKTLTLKVPTSEIFGAELISEKTRILSEDLSILLKTNQIVNDDVRMELNDKFQQELNSGGKQAIVNASCENNILDKANKNAELNLQTIFGFLGFENVEVIFVGENNCSYDELE